MSLVGFKGDNHPQQVGERGARDGVDDRATSPEVFGPLHSRWRFTLDAAASADNAKLPCYVTPEMDGLVWPWAGERVWCNPPYSDVRPWLEKAWAEDDAELVVMILPANRTEQAWWQDLVEPFRDREGSPLSAEFIRGRIRFIGPGKDEIGPNERPPFGCVLLIWDRAKCPPPYASRPDLRRTRQSLLDLEAS